NTLSEVNAMVLSARKKLCSALSILAALLALPGCEVNALNAAETQRVYFSPLQTGKVKPRVVEDPGAPEDGGVDQVIRIVAQVARRREPGTDEGARPAPNLGEVESRFVQRGRYLDLIGIYQHMLSGREDSPVNSTEFADSVNQRLVSAYIDLG